MAEHDEPEEPEPPPPPITRYPRIIWGPYQRKHIEQRHDVSEQELNEAWRSRDPNEDEPGSVHPTFGPSTVSFGFTASERVLKMRWRFQKRDPAQSVFPLTAYTPKRRHRYTGEEIDEPECDEERDREREKRRRRRRKGGR